MGLDDRDYLRKEVKKSSRSNRGCSRALWILGGVIVVIFIFSMLVM
jgi:hypothetical protein